MNKREDRPSELVIAFGNATELFELVEESLDLLAPLVFFLTAYAHGSGSINML